MRYFPSDYICRSENPKLRQGSYPVTFQKYVAIGNLHSQKFRKYIVLIENVKHKEPVAAPKYLNSGKFLFTTNAPVLLYSLTSDSIKY